MAMPVELFDTVLQLPDDELRRLRALIDARLGDDGDDLDDEDRRRLHESLDRGLADARAGRVTSADAVLAKLQRL